MESRFPLAWRRDWVAEIRVGPRWRARGWIKAFPQYDFDAANHRGDKVEERGANDAGKEVEEALKKRKNNDRAHADSERRHDRPPAIQGCPEQRGERYQGAKYEPHQTVQEAENLPSERIPMRLRIIETASLESRARCVMKFGGTIEAASLESRIPCVMKYGIHA